MRAARDVHDVEPGDAEPEPLHQQRHRAVERLGDPEREPIEVRPGRGERGVADVRFVEVEPGEVLGLQVGEAGHAREQGLGVGDAFLQLVLERSRAGADVPGLRDRARGWFAQHRQAVAMPLGPEAFGEEVDPEVPFDQPERAEILVRGVVEVGVEQRPRVAERRPQHVLHGRAGRPRDVREQQRPARIGCARNRVGRRRGAHAARFMTKASAPRAGSPPATGRPCHRPGTACTTCNPAPSMVARTSASSYASARPGVSGKIE